MFTKIQKWGNSQGVRIPKQLLSLASLNEGEDIEMVAEYGKIIIQRAKKPIKKYRIQELFAEYDAGHKPHEEDWGKSVGKEEW